MTTLHRFTLGFNAPMIEAPEGGRAIPDVFKVSDMLAHVARMVALGQPQGMIRNPEGTDIGSYGLVVEEVEVIQG